MKEIQVCSLQGAGRVGSAIVASSAQFLASIQLDTMLEANRALTFVSSLGYLPPKSLCAADAGCLPAITKFSVAGATVGNLKWICCFAYSLSRC